MFNKLLEDIYFWILLVSAVVYTLKGGETVTSSVFLTGAAIIATIKESSELSRQRDKAPSNNCSKHVPFYKVREDD